MNVVVETNVDYIVEETYGFFLMAACMFIIHLLIGDKNNHQTKISLANLNEIGGNII
jgi:hypothetical protein